MKKFMIGLLVLIPIIIILTISVSGMIISAEVSITIESFVLKHQGEEVSSVTVDYSTYNVDAAKYQLIPVYLPSVAQVSGFKWESDNESVATVSDKGAVSFLNCGFVTITAQSKDNIAIRASCAFFVEDDEIHDLTVYDYRAVDDAVQSLTLARYESTQLRLDVNPYNALANAPTFVSSDENVFTCSQEGVIRAVGEGEAILTVTAQSIGGEVKMATVDVSVTGSRLLEQDTVYVYADSYNAGDTVVDLAEVKAGECRTVTIKDGTKEETLTVYKLPFAHALSVKDLDVWSRGEWASGNYIALQSGRRMIPIDLATGTIVDDVTIYSKDTSVIRVEGECIYGISTGSTTVCFEKEGYYHCEVPIKVEQPVSYFELNFDSKEDLVGINSERVFGTYSYYDGELIHGIRVSPKNVYPEGSDETNFSYFVNSEYASVDKSGLVTFREGAENREITVLVKSNFSTNSMARTYTFRHLVKGTNVGLGYGMNVYDKENGKIPSFEPYYDAIRVTNGPNDMAIVFQTNVYMPSREEVEAIEGANQKLGFFHDIYGNGYKMDGQLYQYHYESRLFQQADDDEYAKNPGVTGVKIRDLYVQSYAPKSGESAAAFQELMNYGGTPIRTYFKEHTEYRIDFEYCVFQYAYSHVVAIGGSIGFEGCIFRNSVGPAMLIESLHEQPNFVRVKNCIFSNTLSFAVLLSNGSFPLPSYERVQYNTLEWLGENYIYNWKRTDEIRMDIIPSGVMNDATIDKVLMELNNKMSESARMSFEKGRNADFVVKKNGENYVNMGVFCMAFWAELNTKMNEPRTIGPDGKPYVEDGFALTMDSRYASFLPLDMYTKNLKGLAAGLTLVNIDLTRPSYMILNKGENGKYNTLPDEKYSMDDRTFSKLRGE